MPGSCALAARAESSVALICGEITTITISSASWESIVHRRTKSCAVGWAVVGSRWLERSKR